MSTKQKKIKIWNNTKGIGLIELVIALGMMTAIFSAVAYFSASSRVQTSDLSSVSSCQSLATQLTDLIKSFDNSLVVRNWIHPSVGTYNSQNANDPYCNSTESRTPVCDTLPLTTQSGGYVYGNNYLTHQNIRGAHTWAQSVYNSGLVSLGSGICQMPGVIVPAASFRLVMPALVTLPAWVHDIEIYIRDTTVPCGTVSSSSTAKFEISIAPKFTNVRTPAGQTETCRSSLTLSNVPDEKPPLITSSAVVRNSHPNPLYQLVPPGACTDRRPMSVIGVEGVGTTWQNLSMDFQPNEPGTILLCRKSGFELYPPDAFLLCPDMSVGGPMSNLSMSPGPSEITYNNTPNFQVRMNNMIDTTAANLHVYEFKLADAGGNESAPQSVSFRVHTPQCIPSGLYCPNAAPAWLPPLDAFQGISIRPWDDCTNGVCPPGSHSACDGSLAPTVCVGTNYADDCGIDNCPGSMPQSCAGVDVNYVACGQAAIGQCGAACGIGTGPNCPDMTTIPCNTNFTDACGNDCGLGTNSCPTPAPTTPPQQTPAPGCDCLSHDETVIACNQLGPDSCGQVDVCSPVGTLNCPPVTPAPVAPRPPWNGGLQGPFQCSRHGHGNTNTCSLPISVPVAAYGYTWYRITFYANGHRHGGSGMSLWVGAWGSGYNTWFSGIQRGPILGPEMGGSHPWFMQGWASGNLVTAGGAFGASFNLRLWVDDAEMQAYYTVDAYD